MIGRASGLPLAFAGETHAMATTLPRQRLLDWTPPVLQPRRGYAERVGARIGHGHPVVVFLVGMLASLALISAVSIALGFLVTRAVLHDSGVSHWDEHVHAWLAEHRTSFRTHLSLIGSIISGGVVLPIIAGLTAFVSAVMRKWRLAAFLVFVLAVESASYRITTLVIHRHRPRVHRLEDLPVNASYPSGHTAASIAVYCGLALLLTSMVRNFAFRTTVWCVAVLIVAFDVSSRLYRGMHHPLDVVGGVVVGVSALCLLVLTCRASGAAAGEA